MRALSRFPALAGIALLAASVAVAGISWALEFAPAMIEKVSVHRLSSDQAQVALVRCATLFGMMIAIWTISMVVFSGLTETKE